MSLATLCQFRDPGPERETLRGCRLTGVYLLVRVETVLRLFCFHFARDFQRGARMDFQKLLFTWEEKWEIASFRCRPENSLCSYNSLFVMVVLISGMISGYLKIDTLFYGSCLSHLLQTPRQSLPSHLSRRRAPTPKRYKQTRPRPALLSQQVHVHLFILRLILDPSLQSR